ncbi:hypothetical protein LCGC14_1320790 [marine sediment metagenome]|uniref:Bacteriophage Mu GpT domain-containing protein n=1 Tax=marine sediment metagenome TaxID=412755 RepID=A0A0F9KJN9_9ZZZZ
MAGPITTGNHPKLLWPGVAALYGVGYQEHVPEECLVLFEQNESRQSWEEDLQINAFGLAPVKPQGKPISYASHTQGPVSRYTHVTYALGFIVTMEELQDNLYEKAANSRAESLGFAMRQTRETVGANVYNRATTAGFEGGDGVVLLSASHPSGVGNWSNILTPAADLSEASLEDISIQISKAEDDQGNKIMLRGESLHIPPDLEFEAGRILKSVLQSDSANHNVNVLRQMGKFPKGVYINHYFTDIDAWFVRTNTPHGMKVYDRIKGGLEKDNDFSTKNALASVYARYSFGHSDPRGLYGSPGN